MINKTLSEWPRIRTRKQIPFFASFCSWLCHKMLFNEVILLIIIWICIMSPSIPCSWHVDYVVPRKSWEHRRIKGVHSYGRISKFFAFRVKARRRAALSLHSTARNKLCNQQTCSYKPSHDYEYTGTHICHKSLLQEMLRTLARLCKQRTSRIAKERL